MIYLPIRRSMKVSFMSAGVVGGGVIDKIYLNGDRLSFDLCWHRRTASRDIKGRAGAIRGAGYLLDILRTFVWSPRGDVCPAGQAMLNESLVRSDRQEQIAHSISRPGVSQKTYPMRCRGHL